MRGILGLVLVAACTATEVTPDAAGREEVVFGAPLAALDLLFVVDGAPALAAHEAHLRASVAGWVAMLADRPDGIPSLHVGAISSDLGALGGPAIGACRGFGRDGKLHVEPGAAVNGVFVADVTSDDGHVVNYDGALVDVLGALLAIPSTGCPYSQPIAAAQRALDPASVTNAGFRRADAGLAVVIIGAEDDCSVLSPAELAADPDLDPLDARGRCARLAHAGGLVPTETLAAAAPDAAVSVISAPGRMGCRTAGAAADATPRLDALATQHTDLCADDLSAALAVLPDAPVGSPCLHAAPRLDGGEYACTVADVQHRGTSAETRQALTACSTLEDTTCWRVARDPACPLAPRLAIAIERRGRVRPTDEVVADCAVASGAALF